MFKEVCKKARWQAYAVVRILVGLLFFLFGAMKFGWLGGSEPVQLASMFGVAGVIEIIVGLALVLGFLVRGITVLGSIEMLVALVYVHFPQGWNPIANQGAIAVLFMALFIVLHVHGAGPWSLDKVLWKKE